MGCFEKGVLNKTGKIIHFDGWTYTGEVKEDIPNGKGVLEIDKQKVEGIFENGVVKEILLEKTFEYTSLN